jgi:hypothetical protein
MKGEGTSDEFFDPTGDKHVIKLNNEGGQAEHAHSRQ